MGGNVAGDRVSERMWFLALMVKFSPVMVLLFYGGPDRIVRADMSKDNHLLENNRMTMSLDSILANKFPLTGVEKPCMHTACNHNGLEERHNFHSQINHLPTVSQTVLQDELQFRKRINTPGSSSLFRSQQLRESTRKLLKTSGYFGAEEWMNGQDRKQIASAYYPFSAIGQFDNGCTGTLVGPCHVLTAAHCIYDAKNQQWSDKLGFTPGRTGGGAWEPHGRAEARSTNVMLGWQLFSDYTADLGLVVLDRRIGDVVGTMSFGDNNRGEVIPLNMAGYPNDKGHGEMWYDYCEGAKHDHSTNNVVYHSCTPYNGNSGSPLWVYEPSGSFREIRGVHTGVVSHVSVMLSANGQDDNKQQPFGVMITEHESSTIRRWMHENQC